MRLTILLITLCACALLPLTVRAATPADQAFAAAKQLLDTGNTQQAVTELKGFLAKYPNDPRVLDAQYLLGCGYQNLEQFAPALAAFAVVTEKATTPERAKLRASAYFQTADCQARQQHYEQAVTAYQACLKLAGDDTDLTAQAQYWLGDSLAQLGRGKEALAAYASVLKVDPKHPLAAWSLYAQGALSLQQHDSTAAITTLERIFSDYRDAEVTGDARVLLGMAYAGRAQATKDAAAKAADVKKAQELLAIAQTDETLEAASRQQAALTLAQLYADQGDITKAEASFTNALAGLDPAGRPALEIQLQRGNLLYNAERYDEAATAYATVAASKIADLATEANYWLGNCRYQHAIKSKDQKTYTEAIAAFLKFLTATGADAARLPRATLLLAFCQEDLANQGNAQARTDALESYKTLLKQWPESREAAEAQNGITRLTANMSAAEVQQLAATLPDGAATWAVTLRLAREAFLAGKYDEAIADAQKVRTGATDEANAQAAYLMAAANQRLNRPADAIPLYQQALAKTNAADLRGYAQRGLTRALLDAKQSKAAVESALALNKLPLLATDAAAKTQEAAERWQLLAEAYTGTAQYAEAVAADRHLIAECPASPLLPYAWLNCAWLAEKQQDTPTAITGYREVITRFPDHAVRSDASLRLASLLSAQKQYQQAVEVLRGVPPTAEKADQACYALAWAYQDLGQPAQAQEQFTQLVTKWPKSPLAGDSQYRIGDYQLQQQQYTEANASFAHALMLLAADSPLRPLAVYQQGSSAFSAGKYVDAAQAFTTVLTQYPTSDIAADCLFWLAQAQEKQGGVQAVTARASYQQYLTKYPDGPLALDAALGAGRAAFTAKQYATARADLQHTLELGAQAKLPKAQADRAKDVLPEAQFLLGQCAAAEKQYVEALKAYAAVSAFNMEPWYSRALLEMARCSALNGDLTAAGHTLTLLQQNFPDSDAAKQVPTLAKELGITLATP